MIFDQLWFPVRLYLRLDLKCYRCLVIICQLDGPCIQTMLAILLAGLARGAIIALNAVGFTLVYAAARTINFAHGDLFGLASVLAAMIITSVVAGTQPTWFVAGAALVGAFVGAALFGAGLNVVVERLAFRPFRQQPAMIGLIATVALSFIYSQARLLWPAPRIAPPLLPQEPLVAAPQPGVNLYVRIQDILVLFIGVGLALAVAALLRYTRIGRAIQAWSQDAEQAQLCGVHATYTLQLVFILAGALAGVAAWAWMLTDRHTITSYGLESGLVALTAAVLGGIGRVRGALLSGLAIGVVSVLSDVMIDEAWTPVVTLLLLIVVLVVRPSGTEADDQFQSATIAHGRMSQGRRWLLIGLLGIAAAYPVVDYIFRLRAEIQLTSIFFFVALALGLMLTLGYAGLLNLGYIACFAIGAYTTALLTTPYRRTALPFPPVDSFLLALAVSALAAALFGALLAVLTRRMNGGYLAIAALACGQIVQRLLYNLGRWTGGRDGIAVIPPPDLFGLPLQSPTSRYYLMLVMAALVALACLRLQASRLGRAWNAQRDDALAAASNGVFVERERRRALVLSATIAGITGSFYASIISFVDPGRADLQLTILLLAMVVIGGMTSVSGVILSAAAIATIDQVGIPLLGARTAQLAEQPGWGWLAQFDVRAYNFLAFGVALYLALVFRTRSQRVYRGDQELEATR